MKKPQSENESETVEFFSIYDDFSLQWKRPKFEVIDGERRQVNAEESMLNFEPMGVRKGSCFKTSDPDQIAFLRKKCKEERNRYREGKPILHPRWMALVKSGMRNMDLAHIRRVLEA